MVEARTQSTMIDISMQYAAILRNPSMLPPRIQVIDEDNLRHRRKTRYSRATGALLASRGTPKCAIRNATIGSRATARGRLVSCYRRTITAIFTLARKKVALSAPLGQTSIIAKSASVTSVTERHPCTDTNCYTRRNEQHDKPMTSSHDKILN